MAKLWTEYKTANWDQVKSGYAKLLEIGQGIFQQKEQANNFCYAITYINLLIKENEADPDWYLEKNCLLLLDLNLISSLEKSLDTLNNLPTAKDNNEGSERAIEQELSQRLSDLGIRQSVVERWEKQLVSITDKEQQRKIKLELKNIADVVDGLVSYLLLLLAIMGASMDDKWYTPSSAAEYLTGKNLDYNTIYLIRTLRVNTLSGEEERHDLLRAALEFLDRADVVRPQGMFVEDIIIFSVVLDFIYHLFYLLSDWEQDVLLSTEFYKAIVLGLPVRKILQTELQDALDISQYIALNKKITEILEENNEDIVLSPSTLTKGQPLFEIFSQYLSQAGDDSLDEAKITIFVDNLYKDNFVSKDYYVNWLKEAIYIYTHVKQASLVDWLRDNAPDKQEEQYQLDLLQMFYSFGLHGDLLYIVNYYKMQYEPVVPLSSFIQYLAEAVDLKEEDDLQTAIRLADKLHDNKLLSPDKELVIFDESSGEFIWNKDV